jgi:hypothetical protein
MRGMAQSTEGRTDSKAVGKANQEHALLVADHERRRYGDKQSEAAFLGRLEGEGQMDRHNLICIMAAIIYATPDGQGDTCLDTADSVKRARSIVEEVEYQETATRRAA